MCMENNESGLNSFTNSLGDIITGIPEPIRKNFFKAFSQLCTAAVDVPVAWLEGKADEIRANTSARIQIIKSSGNIISDNLDIPPEYIAKASSKYASKIIKEQMNLDSITINAAKELKSSVEVDDNSSSDEISEDWLNEFENIARLKYSEEMKIVFGKILSGEIRRPGTFSIRTVKVIAQLDNEAAKLFQRFCSIAISLRDYCDIRDARVVTFKGSAASNSLSKYRLGFDNLNILEECGLIISEYHSYMPYSDCVEFENGNYYACIRFQNRNYILRPIEREKMDRELKLYGVRLTNVGKELLDIIPIEQNEVYTRDLVDFLKEKSFNLVEIEI